MLALLAILFSAGSLSAQTSTAWGYSTGYGNVYGTFGLAQTMQSMYNVARAQSRQRAAGSPASKPANNAKPAKEVVTRPRPVLNYGRYVPDPSVDTSKAFAEALGDTAEERALIKQIYAVTMSAYESDAKARGWSNNIAAGLTFFTVAAINAYHDEVPSDEAANDYFKLMNSTLDEIPSLGKVTSEDKQNFNNMAVGFAGLILAGNIEAKNNNDAAALAINKKLAAMLIELVLKTKADDLRLENGRIIIQ